VQAIGPAFSQSQWIHVGDRGADIFRLLEHIRRLDEDFLIRAAQDRCVQVGDETEEDDEEVTRLFELARSLPAQDSRTKDLPRLHDRPARQAFLQVSWSKIQIQPPKNGGALSKQAVQASLIRVWEPLPPSGEEPLEWVLLTSIPIENVEQAWQCVDWYAMRWTRGDGPAGWQTLWRGWERLQALLEGVLFTLQFFPQLLL
jgi:hypothetical protein